MGDYYEAVRRGARRSREARRELGDGRALGRAQQGRHRGHARRASTRGGWPACSRASPMKPSPARSPRKSSSRCGRKARTRMRSSKRRGSSRSPTRGAIEKTIDEVMAANPKQLADYRSGKDKLFGFFVGQVMKVTGGKANPAQVNELLKKKAERGLESAAHMHDRDCLHRFLFEHYPIRGPHRAPGRLVARAARASRLPAGDPRHARRSRGRVGAARGDAEVRWHAEPAAARAGADASDACAMLEPSWACARSRAIAKRAEAPRSRGAVGRGQSDGHARERRSLAALPGRRAAERRAPGRLPARVLRKLGTVADAPVAARDARRARPDCCCSGCRTTACVRAARCERAVECPSRTRSTTPGVACSCSATRCGREELQALSDRDILRRLFAEDDVRLFESAPVFFRCRCSRERVIGMLRSAGGRGDPFGPRRAGQVEVRCDFCNRAYRFDPVDVEQLFAHAPAADRQRYTSLNQSVRSDSCSCSRCSVLRPVNSSARLAAIVRLIEYKDIFISLMTSQPMPTSFLPAVSALARGCRADAAAPARAARARRADGRRDLRNRRAEPAARLAASEAAVRCRAARSFPRAALGLLPRACRRARSASTVQQLLALVREDDDLLRRDRKRMEQVIRERARRVSGSAARRIARSRRRQSIDSIVLSELADEPIGALLDVGTGSGHLLGLLGAQATRAVGIDISSDALRLARTKVHGAGLSHCELQRGDMYDLPFAAPLFDTVTADRVLATARAARRGAQRNRTHTEARRARSSSSKTSTR